MRAAVDEFARYGLAGARVYRIAETAAANKRSIYMHFGTKEELFDRVVADSMVMLADSLSFDHGDLAGYAGDMFDRLERWPHPPAATKARRGRGSGSRTDPRVSPTA